MNIDRALKAASLVAGLFALSACAIADKELAGYQDPTFGSANRATYAAMVVDPAPEYDEPVPATDGEHAARVTEAYRKGKVEQPERIKTTKSDGPQ